MKKIFSILALSVLISCGDGGEKEAETSSDTTGKGHNTNDHTSSGKSMMQMMQDNMDQMKAVKSTGNPDNDFASLMKIHHMGALEMAQVEIAQGTDAHIKEMAQKMIDDQQKEIAELNTFLSGHKPHGGGDAFYKEAMSQMSNMKMDMDHSGSVDKQFVQMMITHHQGAIDMAKAYLKTESHEEKLKTMAKTIISTQQKEIQELQSWLGTH